MIYLQLFWSFVKIGFTSFGGLSMIPLIKSEMLSHSWMTSGEVTDIVAIAEMTPGPLGLNCATFAGIRTAGMLGAVAANLGMLMPSLTLCLFVASCFARFRHNRVMEKAMVGIRPACIGMIAGVVLSLAVSNYYSAGTVDIKGLLIGALSFYLLTKRKVDVPVVIGISAILGLLFYGMPAI